MKRAVYILLFVVLGVIVSFLAHAAIELSLVKLLVSDFETYSLGLSWSTWFVLHYIMAGVLFLIGAGVGLWQGIYWWGVLYEGKPPIHKNSRKSEKVAKM